MRTACLFLFLILVTATSAAPSQLLKQSLLKPYMFTQAITGDLDSLEPTNLAISPYWPFPVEIYEISMMRAYHQFLPSKWNKTQVFAYAGKVNGKFVPTFPGPFLSVLKNMPIYVIWSNDIDGKHILPVDTSPPFDMVADFQNEVPVVPHAHGLETEMGPDGQPMGFWTKSGRKGPDFFSLKSRTKKPNQAIFRYHNTKEGLFWYHDHAMAITRLNVYAGLVAFYEIVDSQISYEERNILRYYGDIERKYFALADKSFKQNGELFYPTKSESSDFSSWVPQFFGNTMTVNGKVWPKINLQPKLYRLVLLNGCQSRFLNIYFQYENRRLDFQIFRRDSDFLKRPVTLKEHLLLIGGRIEIFLNLTGIKGQVMLKNDASTPYPMGEAPNQFMQKIMKIVVNPPYVPPRRNLQQAYGVKLTRSRPVQSQPLVVNNQPTAPQPLQASTQSQPTPKILPIVQPQPQPQSQGQAQPQKPIQTFLSAVTNRLEMYSLNLPSSQTAATLDFLDESQAPNYNPPSQMGYGYGQSSKVISLKDFVNSNDQYIQVTTASTINDTNTIEIITSNIATQKQKIATINPEYFSGYFSKDKVQSLNISITNTGIPYPRFGEGKPYFTILADVQNSKDELSGVMIDGVPVRMGCKGSVFREGEVYDFYIINLTMDDHPIHIHLVNYQVVKRFRFNVKKYRKDWQAKNGQLQPGGLSKIPDQLDVRPYKLPNSDEQPAQQQKLFMDVIRVPSQMVTVARVKFSNHYGKAFPFDVSGARYVWHCHILEHEDNQMMRYFCVE